MTNAPSANSVREGHSQGSNIAGYQFGRWVSTRGVVMEIVGHSALEMTMNVYGHVNLETQRRALDELDRALAVADRWCQP